MSARLAKGLAALALAGLAATVPATAEVSQEGTLRVSVAAKLEPKRLPRTGAAPIAVSVGGEITTTDGTLAPQLRSLQIELNRHGHLDARGLPSCRAEQIHPGSSAQALRACRGALVGRGSFAVEVVLGAQEPYATSGRLLVFNATRKGRPAILGHIYSRRPFTTSFLIPFAIKELRGGRYGTLLSASLPQALGDWGHLSALRMRLARRYSHRGQRRSFISAGCPAPQGFSGTLFPLARTSFGFADGRELTTSLTRRCRVRG